MLRFNFVNQIVIALCFAVSFAAKAQTEPPQFMTVDGRLYDSTTPEDPLLDNSVLMKIQVLNPAKTCILYEEEQTVSTLSSNGYFNVRVGSPTSGAESLKRTTNDSGNSMMAVFQNQNASITGRTSGGGGCSYTPAAGDTRYFRYIVTPSTTGVTSTLSPDMQIDSVPQALVAETLQGMSPDDFVQINSDVTQAKANSLFGGSYTTLTGLLAGTSSLYLRNTTNGTVIPSRATDPLTPSAGQIWYDSDDNVLRYYDGTVVQTLSSGSADPTKLPLAGGTMAGAIDMATNDITDIGHMTQAPQRTFRFGVYTTAQQTSLIATPLIAGHEGTVWYNTTTNKLMFWDGAAEYAVSPVDSVFGRTGAVVAVAGDYTATQITNTAAGNIAATDAQAAINELDTEKVAKSGDTMTGSLNIDNEQELRLSEADGSGANYVAIKSPTTLSADYTLTLPATDGDSGQVLTTDGSGVLSWTSLAAVGETNTASNQGAGGVGLYDAKSGVDLQFRNINAASNKISVALDAGNKEVDLNVNEANLDTSVIPNTAAGTISATNTQAAINELDTEKVATTRAINTAAGSGLSGGGDLSADRSLSVNINGMTAETAVAGADEILIYDASASALRKMTRTNFVLSETEVDAMVSNNGYLTSEADTLATVTGRGASTATNITMNTQAQTRYADSAGGEYAAIQAPATIASNYVLTLPTTDGDSGQVLTTDGSGVLTWTSLAAVGETNTASNQGAGGVGLYDAKSGVDLQFRNINAANNKISVALDAGNKEVDINVNEANLSTASIPNTAAGSIAATNTQAAINELDTEKVAKSGDTMTGSLNLDNEQELRLSEADGSGANYVAIKALTTLGANYTLTLPPDDGNSGQYLQTDGNGVLTWVTPAGVGETNTASNQGVGGVGVFKQKTTYDLEFRNINAASNKISVALDAGNNEIDINVAEANLDTSVIPNTAAGTISATNTQAAINELDTEKVATTRAINTAAGSGLTGGGDLSADRSLSVNINGTTAETAVAGADEILIYDASATALRKMTRTNFVLSETEVDAMVSNNGYLSSEADTLATVTGRGAVTATNITMNTQAQTRYADSAGGEYAAIQAPATIASNYILTLPTTDGDSGQVLTTDGSGVLSWTSLAAVGETNTASNQGAGGVGLYDAKSGVDLQFRNINAASNKISVALDAGNKEVDINVNEANLSTASIPNTAAGNIAATNTQAAINELDAEKVAKSGDTMTGSLNLDNEQELRLSEADGSGANYVAIKALTTLGANYTLTLPPDDGNSGQYLQTDGNGVLTWVTPAGVGETNTASNQGAGGVGVFKQKTTYDLEFRNINAASNKVSVALDAGNNEIDINVAEANFDSSAIPNTAAGNIAATNTQAAINELDTEKVSKAGDTMTGLLTMGPRGLDPGDGGAIAFRELAAGGTNTAMIRAPAALAADYVLVLPGDDGSSGQVLTTNGSGVLTWTTISTTIADDSLNFDKFSDTMSLDASTDIAASGTNVLSITNSGTGNSFVVNDQASDTSPFVIDASGNVGIGTTVPTSKLEVYGQINISSGSTITSNPTSAANNTGWKLGMYGNGYALGVADYTMAIKSAQWVSLFSGNPANDATTGAPDSNATISFNSGNGRGYFGGNVGIGTTVPGTLLDVSGAITSRPSGAGAGQTGQLILRELAAGGTNTATIRAPDALASDYALTLPTSAGSSGQVLQTDGTGVLSWATALTGSTGFINGGNSFGAAATLGTNDNYALQLEANNSTAMTINPDGSVGVGNAGSNVRFSVQGGLRIDEGDQSNGGGSLWQYGLTFGAGSGEGITSKRGAGGNQYGLDFFTGGGDIRMSLTSGGSLGVGTTTPGTLLDVAGAITSRPNGTGTGQTGQLILRELAAGGTNTATIRAPDALAADYALTLPLSAGSANQVLTTDGSGVLSWTTPTGGVTADSLNFTEFADAMTLDASTNIAVTGSNLFSISKTGTGDAFVVNTNTYPFRIDNDGFIHGDNAYFASVNLENLTAYSLSTNNGWNASGFVVVDVGVGNANPIMNWVKNSTTRMILDTNGNLGVGTTTPGTLLDVAGAITSRPNGTGTGQTGQLILRELAAGGTNTATIRAPDALAADYALTLPSSAGSANQVLTTDGAGVLSWTTPSTASVTADSLNFTDFADAMTLDASTDISVTGSDIFSITNSGTGSSFRVNDEASDTTPFVVDAAGLVGIGTTTPSVALDVVTTGSTTVRAEASGANNSMFRADTFGAGTPYFTGYDANGVVGAPTVTTSGNGLGIFSAMGHNGTGYATDVTGVGNAGIAIVADGNFSGTSYPASLRFYTTPTGSQTSVNRVTFSSNGGVGIGTTAPGALLHINGMGNETQGVMFGSGTAAFGERISGELATYFSGTARHQINSGAIFSGASHGYRVSNSGTVTFAPSGSDTDSGLGTISDNVIALYTANTNRVNINATGLVGIGTTSPGTILDAAGAITSRPFGTATGETGQLILRELAAGGTNTATIRAPDALAADYALTLPDSAGSSGQLLQTNGSGVLSWVSAPVTGGTVAAGAGSSATPALSFSGDANTGFYNPYGDAIGIAVNGNNIFTFDSNGMYAGSGIYIRPSGATSAVNPVYTFEGDDNTGMFRPAADVVGFSTAGTERMRISSTGSVGIGTTAPSTNLHVLSAGGSSSVGALLVSDSADSDYVHLDPNFGLTFNRSPAYINNNFVGGSLILRTSNSTALDTSAMTITGSGSVGIGTTNPGFPLEVNGAIVSKSTMPHLGLFDSDATADTGRWLLSSSTANTFRIQAVTDVGAGGGSVVDITRSGNNVSAFQVGTVATPAFKVDTVSGNVGIGSTAPQHKLDVWGSGDYTARIMRSDSDNTAYSPLMVARKRADATAPGANFGAAISYMLEGFTNDDLVRTATITSRWDANQTNDTTARDAHLIFATLLDNTLNEAMRITSAGNVGINIGAPTQTLEVGGSGLITANMYVGSDANTNPASNNTVGVVAGSGGFISTNRTGGGSAFFGRQEDGVIVQFYSAGTAEGSISLAGTTVSYNAFTGSHFALTDEKVARGELVSMDGEPTYKYVESGEPYYNVKISKQKNAKNILGAMLDRLEPTQKVSLENPYQVMAVGNGDMWVIDKGEDVQVGDYLIASDVPGHAEKDIGEFEVAHVVARVAENIRWKNVSKKINGVKHKKISVTFEQFDRFHAKKKFEVQERAIASLKTAGDKNAETIKKLQEENKKKTQQIEMMKAYLCSKDPKAPFCN